MYVFGDPHPHSGAVWVTEIWPRNVGAENFFTLGTFWAKICQRNAQIFRCKAPEKIGLLRGGGRACTRHPPPPRPESVWPLPRPGGGGGHPSLPQTRTPSLRRIMFTSQRAKNKHPNLAFPRASTPENGAPVYPKVQRPASGPKQSKKVKECAKGQHACKRTLPESVNP